VNHNKTICPACRVANAASFRFLISTRAAIAAVAMVAAPLAGPPASHAQMQTAEQARCITTMNDAAAKVAKAQLGVAQRCLKAASAGRLEPGQTAQQCLTADNSGKIEKATTSASAKAATVCVAPLPDFGFTSAATGSSAAIAGGRGLFGDVFGSNLDAAAIDAEADSAGAKCQGTAAKSSGKLLAAMLGEFRACKKSGLGDGTVSSGPALADCLEAIDADAKGRIDRVRGTMSLKLASSCATTTQATAFPGACDDASDFVACVEIASRCRACRIASGADALGEDCDLFDDAIANESCTEPEETSVHGLTIPAGHPRLWFDAARLEQARTWFQSNPFTPPSHEDSAAGYADVALHGATVSQLLRGASSAWTTRAPCVFQERSRKK
jgi:hypothetical protein